MSKRVAVIGCGHLGTFHARLYAELDQAELIGVVDTNLTAAKTLGEELDVPFATSLAELPGEVDAVSVATPTTSHYEVAAACLEAGLDTLVEKPITQTVEQARKLVELADRNGPVLAVGHVERFNPVVRAVASKLGNSRFVESHRLAPFVARSLDVDVVLDLMIHDIDLTLAQIPDEIVSIDAVGVPVLTPGEDIANARIRFENGAVANLTASRVSRDKVRKIRFFGPRHYHSLDLFAGTIEHAVLSGLDAGGADEQTFAKTLAAIQTAATAATQGEPNAEGPDAAAAVPAGAGTGDPAALAMFLSANRLKLDYGSLPVERSNALRDELSDFIGATDGAPLEGASGKDGLRALEVAESIRGEVQDSLDRLKASSAST